MKIEVRFTPAMVESTADLRGKTVVVIDTLRATSTIVTALMAGAREVIPVPTAEEAVKVAQRLGTDRTLLCGERGALKIDGFHLGNSPAEYTSEVVRGKSLLLTTTNGTSALLKARDVAERIVCASLLNVRAVANDLRSRAPQQVMILCAGTRGHFSMEDAITAGALIEAIAGLADSPLLLDDGAVASRSLFSMRRGDLAGALADSDHGRTIVALGLGEDIRFCSRIDLEDAPVPVLSGSNIRIGVEGGG